jgi:hypothetical protein
MSVPLDSESSQSSSGYEDGLGRRALAFDRESGGMLERLVLRPELSAFEEALKERVAIIAGLEDERFAPPRGVERDDDGRLTVVSEYLAGRRLSDIIDAAAEHGIVAGLDAGIGLLLELLPAVARLHDAGLAHGALAPGRVMITPAGQIVLLDSIYAEPLERLKLTRKRLWGEFRLAFPPTAGLPRFDKAADLGHASMVAATLIVGRALQDNDYPEGLSILRQEILEIASIRGSKGFAEAVDRFFAATLPLAGRRATPSADEAAIDLRKLVRKELGINTCRTALIEFFQQVEAADAERLAALTNEDMPAARADIEAPAANHHAAAARLEAERVEAERAEKARSEHERAEAEKARVARERAEQARLDQERAEQARLEQERAEKARLEAERLEAERVAREKAEAARREAERIEREKAETARLEAERIEREKAEKARLEAERLEAERIAREQDEKVRLEAERLQKARLEAERIEREKAEAARLARERAEKARLEAERLEAERIAREKAEEARREAERAEKARLEAERIAREKAEKARLEAERLEAERIAREKAEKARLEAERLEAERVAREKAEKARLEAERLERERLEAERVAREQAEKARLEAERLEAERIAREKAEKARLEAERLERERLEAERRERERLEAERLERERLEAERIEKERAEKARLEAERIEKERVEKARREAERAEKARLEAERAEKARLEAERVERERQEQARLEAERREKQRLEAERLEKERAEKARLENERLERERAEAVRLAEEARLKAERLERERLEAQREAEKARLESERLAQERVEAERRERERVEADRRERERLEQERIAADRAAAERAERDRAEAARVERERAAAAAANADAEPESAPDAAFGIPSPFGAPPPPAPPAPPAAPASNWLVSPDRAASFEPPVHQEPPPAPTARVYPIYVPPSEPEAWTPNVPGPTPVPIEVAPVAAKPPSKASTTSASSGTGIRLKLQEDTFGDTAARSESRREPETMSAAGAYRPFGANQQRRPIPWKLIAAGLVLVAGAFAVSRGYTPSADPVVATVRKTTAPPTPRTAAPPATGNGRVTINTQPAGAKILLDGKPVGDSPLTLDSVAPGRHVLTITGAAGSTRRNIRVESGKTLTVDVAVFSGFVAIAAPFVLDVSENGKALGTNETSILLSPGRHELRVANKDLGYVATQTVDILPGEVTRVTLDPKGTANINAAPWAEVFIDGTKAGETPIANISIRLGIREIVFRNPQYPDRKVTVTIKATDTATIAVDFLK